MTNEENYIDNQPELNGEILGMISGSSISWNKTKEDIWSEMLEKMNDKSSQAVRTKTIFIQFARYAAAAVFVLLAGISAFAYFYTKTTESRSTARTEIYLPDHSKVIVYANSVISYKPLLWKISRTVNFNGEAFFAVQKGKKFEVISKKGKTVVLGTQFIIYSRNNDYDVTCVSGKVKVVESVHKNEAIITADQEAILKPDGYFEILDKKALPKESLDNSQHKTEEQIIDDQIKTVLSTHQTQKQQQNAEERQTPAEKQVEIQKQVREESNPTVEKENIKEQIQSQNQAASGLQKSNAPNVSTAQPQAGNKEQEQNRNSTEQATEQNTNSGQGKDKFRRSLTPEQISILEDTKMSREEKKKAFMESLSPEQRKLLQEEYNQRAGQNGGNKTGQGTGDNPNEQQKVQTKEQIRANAGRENREQNQQNLENKGNPNTGNDEKTGQGNNNGQGSQNGKGN